MKAIEYLKQVIAELVVENAVLKETLDELREKSGSSGEDRE